MKRFIYAVGLLLVLLAPALPAGAADYKPLGDACSTQSANGQSTACTGGVAITGNNGVLKKVSTIIASLAGIAAIIIIIIGGLQYVFSAGDAQKAASARSAILGGVIGLVIIVSAQGILLFVLSKLR